MRYASDEQKAYLFSKQGGLCAVCGRQLEISDPADHIVLFAIGGNKMQAEQARHEKDAVVQGTRTDLELRSNGTKLQTSGNGSAYLLRRLARLGGDWIERYEAGEFASVRQAAIAAGIVKVPSVLDQLRKLWGKASEADRRTFMEEVGRGR